MNITKQMIKDFEATRDFWNWAREQNKKIKKSDWPEFYRIKHLSGHCAFCVYVICSECPIRFDKKYNCNDVTGIGLYYEWRYGTIEESKEAADKIYQISKDYVEKLKEDLKDEYK